MKILEITAVLGSLTLLSSGVYAFHHGFWGSKPFYPHSGHPSLALSPLPHQRYPPGYPFHHSGPPSPSRPDWEKEFSEEDDSNNSGSDSEEDFPPCKNKETSTKPPREHEIKSSSHSNVGATSSTVDYPTVTAAGLIETVPTMSQPWTIPNLSTTTEELTNYPVRSYSTPSEAPTSLNDLDPNRIWGVFEPTTKAPKLSVDACLRICPVTSEYNPVCGTNGVTYDNPGRLECAQKCGVDVQVQRETACLVNAGVQFTADSNVATAQKIKACIGMCTLDADFSPVCGTNNVTYFNIDRLQCAKKCGEAVDILCRSACNTYACQEFVSASTNPVIDTRQDQADKTKTSSYEECTKTCSLTTEYNPVCGSNDITYNNPGLLLCDQFCGVDVKVLQFSTCSVSSSIPTTTSSELDTQACVKNCRAVPNDINNPVCGTNNITYKNIGEMECSRDLCGVSVEVRSYSPCSLVEITTQSIIPQATTEKINTTPQESTPTSTQQNKINTTPHESTPTNTQQNNLSILELIFGSSTTQETPTTEFEEIYDIDMRFGTVATTVQQNNGDRIVYPSD